MGTETEDRTVVYLGNRKAVEVITEPGADQAVRRPLPGKLCTTIVLAPGLKLMEAANDITHHRGVWTAHSDAEAPAWVASTDPALAQLLADHYGCQLREPEPDHQASGGMPTADEPEE